jgi:hypothetical protein
MFKDLGFYQKYQLALLTMIIFLWVVLIFLRLIGHELPDDITAYQTAIWAIILLLIDPNELHKLFTSAIHGDLIKWPATLLELPAAGEQPKEKEKPDA